MQESINWIDAAKQKPDADIDVLIAMDEANALGGNAVRAGGIQAWFDHPNKRDMQASVEVSSRQK